MADGVLITRALAEAASQSVDGASGLLSKREGEVLAVVRALERGEIG